MLSKYLKWAIVAGLFSVILITPFYVSEVMFFPFITGKNFLFRIVVEIIFALWLILAMSDTRYRPKASPVLWAATAVVAVLTLSTIFGVNPYRSFWSNYERMEGLIGHLHLFAYFLVLSGVFITQKEWRRFFYVISASGAAMAFYGYLQAFGKVAISSQSGPRVDGAFGNASYMAIFILFNAFLAAFLYFDEERRWLKNIFGVLVLFEIPVIFLTATRGAILGLIGGIILLVLILLILSKDKRVKIASISVIGGIIILIGGFLLVQNRDFITQNPALSRLSNLSLQDRTVQSRFSIWSISLEGFKERPVLGWGLENYGQVFNKYYRPSLWPQEAWFDRSHNIIFDWLIHGGVPGLLAYLSIFASAIYVFWRNYMSDKNSKNLMTAAVFTSLFSAYFFHNFFVFDNLISYVMFFSILGFGHFIFVQNRAPDVKAVFTPTHSFLSAILVFLLAAGLYFLNIKPLLANTSLLRMIKDASSQGQNINVILSDFDKSVSYGTFGIKEAREQLSAYANAVSSSGLSPEIKTAVLQKSAAEFEKQIKDDPDDARTYVFISSMYGQLGRYEDSLAILNKALTLSPKKQQIYFLMAETYLSLGQPVKSFEAMKTAYDSDPAFPDAVRNLAVIAIVTGQSKYAGEVLTNHFGTDLVADVRLVNAYVRVGNFSRARDIWIELVKQSPKNPQYRVNLAATHLRLGERSQSIQELEKAIELNPEFKETGEYLINEIRAGRDPSE